MFTINFSVLNKCVAFSEDYVKRNNPKATKLIENIIYLLLGKHYV